MPENIVAEVTLSIVVIRYKYFEEVQCICKRLPPRLISGGLIARLIVSLNY